MDSETSIKNLEAQNAQVHIAILELAKGQRELKALMIKKKKKPKGSVGLSHLARKLKIPARRSKKAPFPEVVGRMHESYGDTKNTWFRLQRSWNSLRCFYSS